MTDLERRRFPKERRISEENELVLCNKQAPGGVDDFDDGRRDHRVLGRLSNGQVLFTQPRP